MGINVLNDSKSSPRRIWFDSPVGRNQMSGLRIMCRNTTKTTTRADEFFDDFDIVEIILLLYVGIGTLNVILANISETPIEITDIS